MSPQRRLTSLEEYIESGRNKGFSNKEIRDSLLSHGYSEDIVDLADLVLSSGKQIRLLWAGIAALIIVLFLVLGYVAYRPAYSAVSPLPVQSLQVNQPSAAAAEGAGVWDCLDRPSDKARDECMEKLGLLFEEGIRESPAADPARESMITQLAVIRRNASLCEQIVTPRAASCIDSVSAFGALKTKDETKCLAISNLSRQAQCVIASLMRRSPEAAIQVKKDETAMASRAAAAGDPALCKSLLYPFTQEACRVSASDQIAQLVN